MMPDGHDANAVVIVEEDDDVVVCIQEEGKEEGRAVEVCLAQWGMPCSAGLHMKAARVRAK